MVANLFREHQVLVIDLDEIVHDLEDNNEQLINEIAKEFGPGVLSNNKIDRKALGRIVFGNHFKLKKLTNIINPYLLREINQQLTGDLVILDAPTLFENALYNFVDEIIMVTCDQLIQLKRLINRNQISISKANLLINSQWPSMIKQQLSDYVIDSTFGIDSLEKQVNQLLNKLR